MDMKFRGAIAAILAATTLVGCATTQSSHIQPISSSAIQSVVDDMKRQVSVYVAYQNSKQGTSSVINTSGSKPCGNGLIDFDITSVKLEILTTLESNVSSGIDVGPIVSGGGATVKTSFGTGRSFTNTQELVLVSDLLPNRSFAYPGTETIESAPIAGSLACFHSHQFGQPSRPSNACDW